jgi:hypothetical protein
MKRKQFQLLLILTLFISVLMLALSPSFLQVVIFAPPELSLVNTEASLFDSLMTVGDVITFYSMFAATVTIAIWITTYKKGRSK